MKILKIVVSCHITSNTNTNSHTHKSKYLKKEETRLVPLLPSLHAATSEGVMGSLERLWIFSLLYYVPLSFPIRHIPWVNLESKVDS